MTCHFIDSHCSHSYAGSLTFSFSSGLKITIPNSQLVLPYMTINDQGTTISNSSIREIMLNKLQGINANDMPILGQTFLTSAYLMVNQDASTFTLWQNQPTLNQSLVAIGPPKACTAPVNTSATITGSSSSNISTFPASAVNRISGGAIAGLCVGAIAFSALVLGLALWLRRRSLQRKDSGRADGPTNPTMSGLDKSEVPRDGYPPQELPARSTMQQAPQLYPSEMAA